MSLNLNDRNEAWRESVRWNRRNRVHEARNLLTRLLYLIGLATIAWQIFNLLKLP